MASIYDVAKLAGVSKTLVSRVINDQKGVSEKSRKKILDAMNELNYRPNAIARSLVLQKTNIIGVIMDSLCQAYYFDFIKGIEQEIEKSSYEVLFCSARDNVEAKKKYVDFFSQGRTDGFIMYGSNVRDHKLIEELEHSRMPMVIVENDVDGLNINNICVDNRYGSEVMIEYLIKQGCKNIYHVTGDLAVKAAIDRMEGYRAALRKHGMECREEMIIQADFTVEGGCRAMRKALAEGMDELPDAIYFGSDATAAGGMIALEEKGIRIPEDIKVAGFDNDLIMLPDRKPRRLTTLAQPMFEMGANAARLLLDDIKDSPQKKKRMIYYPELVIGETT